MRQIILMMNCAQGCPLWMLLAGVFHFPREAKITGDAVLFTMKKLLRFQLASKRAFITVSDVVSMAT